MAQLLTVLYCSTVFYPPPTSMAVMLGLRGLKLSRAAMRQGRLQARASSFNFPKPYTVPDNPWGSNRAARLEMAAAYRGLDQLGLNEGVCNHLSMMAPRADGKGQTMLVISYGLHWSEVTASSLVGLNEQAEVVDGEGTVDIAASSIHLGIRHARPDATVVMHTHQPYSTALACMKDPTLQMIHQNSARFYKRVAYDSNYSGLALAIDEGKRLGEALGDKDILFMGHHGVISVATNVALAFDHLYYLERAAQLQVLAFSMQREVGLIPEKNCKLTCDELWKEIQGYGDAHFYSMYRRLRKTQPDFEQ